MYCSLAKKGPWAAHLTLGSDRGWADIRGINIILNCVRRGKNYCLIVSRGALDLCSHCFSINMFPVYTFSLRSVL